MAKNDGPQPVPNKPAAEQSAPNAVPESFAYEYMGRLSFENTLLRTEIANTKSLLDETQAKLKAAQATIATLTGQNGQ